MTGTGIDPAHRDDLGDVLPLIAAYQRFYGVERPDDETNRRFFARVAAPDGDRGVLLVARDDGRAVGFACVYWTWESIGARDVALLHDLFVVPERRGSGTGRALLDAAADAARARGLPALSWSTALDNRTAQRLYERYPAARSAWFEYTLDLAAPQ